MTGQQDSSLKIRLRVPSSDVRRLTSSIHEMIAGASVDLQASRRPDSREALGQTELVDVVISLAVSVAGTAAYEALKSWLQERAQGNHLIVLDLHDDPKKDPPKA
jgi:hypothetical protein